MSILIEGVGIHSGSPVTVRISPGGPGTGIIFTRLDAANCPDIPGTASAVTSLSRGVTLGRHGYNVASVEHLLAASALSGLTDLVVEVDGPELPIFDGSLQPYMDSLSGIQKKGHSFATGLRWPVSSSCGSSWIRAEPTDSFYASFKGVGPDGNHAEVSWHEGDTIDVIASARTFCRLSELPQLWDRGLARGGGLDTALVYADVPLSQELKKALEIRYNIDNIYVNKKGLLNDQTFRMEHEWAWHKLADLIGDFMLCKGLPQIKVSACESGHFVNISHISRMRASLYPI